jgi:hypothetical protein
MSRLSQVEPISDASVTQPLLPVGEGLRIGMSKHQIAAHRGRGCIEQVDGGTNDGRAFQ